jgi:DNA helicase MCM8
MASALLSRFDLLFILLDRADEERDRLISEHVMGIRRAGRRGHTSLDNSRGDDQEVHFAVGDADVDPVAATGSEDQGDSTLSQRLRRECAACAEARLPFVDPVFFRKYIEFAKTRVFPRLTPPAAKVLQRMYLSLRSKGVLGSGGSGGDELPVTTRHLESLIRLSQARARMELRDEVGGCMCMASSSLCLRIYLASHTFSKMRAHVPTHTCMY